MTETTPKPPTRAELTENANRAIAALEERKAALDVDIASFRAEKRIDAEIREWKLTIPRKPRAKKATK